MASDLDKIQKYRDLETQLRTHIASSDYTPEAFQLATKISRLNPEYYTVWNVRRRLLTSGLLSKPSVGSSPSKASPNSSQTDTTITCSADSSSSSSIATQQNPKSQTTGKNGITVDPTEKEDGGTKDVDDDQRSQAEKQQNDLNVLESELQFTVPLLMEFPKCYWIWKYRSWLLQQANDRLEPAITRRIWEEELGLDTKMLTKDRRNFHAWNYRRNVVKQLESSALNGKSMVESEFEFTRKMIQMDLSNFSAWHNRSKLIPRLLQERGADDVARRKFFDDELALIRDALNVGPEDQSLWYYHQFLMLDVIDQSGQPTITSNLSVQEKVAYINREIVDIKDLLEDYDDCKLLYERLMDYTRELVTLEKRRPSSDEESALRTWLSKLRKLDPLRNGRWNDIGKQLALDK
ncbi:Rab geranylgeranyltransferase [Gnomoniopsis sp. IMI 355080]|nr:Rab geranylgeranyltransferase [Gnomoniopsis sp. IMI 355080]